MKIVTKKKSRSEFISMRKRTLKSILYRSIHCELKIVYFVEIDIRMVVNLDLKNNLFNLCF